jgi:hypothetical protein
MNKVTWVIQTNLLNDLSVQGVWRSAEEAGANVQEAIIVPFQDELANEEELLAMHVEDDHVVIPYGSCKLTRISQKRGWRGNCFNPDTFKVSVWNSNRDDMLNGDSVHMRVKDAAEFFKGKILADKWFIRPEEDLKAFNGTVTEAEEIINWMYSTASGNFNFSEDTSIIIAPVKKLYSEARFFIVGGKVVDGSYYRFGGRTHTSHIDQQETIDMAQVLADKWLPHENCVMDVADTDDGLKVIEFNTLNSSGFYAHKIPVIVQAVTEWARNLNG